MITKDTIDEIIETARIEEVVGDYVILKKRGVNLLGLCPFHNEKTPSFTVSPAKGIYKCFGCGKAGNSVSFIMDHEHLTYPESLKYLAKKYNIDIKEDKSDVVENEAQSKKEALFIVSEFAQKYFSETLFNTDEGKAIGLSYFKERGFSEQIIKKFQLGYCSEKWDSFTKEALNQGYNLDYLIETGLTIPRDNNNFDRFKGRAIFPIHNLSGRTIGFGGRVLVTDNKSAKYVNSPESEIYHKSNVLYGISFARNSIIEKKNCYLVEGYTDVISLHQVGIENVVASSGTSLTIEQIRLIRRYSDTVTILYDGDSAGIKASFRGIDMVFEEGLNVRLVQFPEKEDPDSFARKHRASEVVDFIENNAVNFITFKTSILFEEAKHDPIKRAEFIKEIANTIAIIPDNIARSEYIKECAEKVRISEQILILEINKIRKKKNAEKKTEPESSFENEVNDIYAEKQIDVIEDDIEYQEKDVIRLLLNFSTKILIFKEIIEKEVIETKINLTEFIINELLGDVEFENPIYKNIFEEFVKEFQEGRILEQQYFIGHKNDKVREASINLLSSKYSVSANWKLRHGIIVKEEEDTLSSAVNKSILSFKQKKILNLKLETQKKLKESNNDEEIIILQQMCIKYDKALQEVANKGLGRIIIK